MTRFGRYTLLTRLGRGGMGEVWQATFTDEQGRTRPAVIKRVLAELVTDPEIVRMFAREASLSEKLDHPHLVRLLEFGDIDGEYFMAMEFVDGVNLSRVQQEMRRHGSPSVGLGVFAVRDVARALAYAHALPGPDGELLGLVHRDVSPSNVMVSFDGDTKLLDFGIAKLLGAVTDSHTKTGTFKGKIEYMAPEQAEGEPADQRSDQFALGVVLHELITGERLFRGENEMQTWARIRRAEVAAPSTINPEVPPALDAICARALARVPGDRFSSCGEMADALDAIVAQLDWSPARSAQLIEALFPGRDTAPTRVELRLGAAPERVRTRVQAPGRRGVAMWGVLGLGTIVAAGAWVAIRSAAPDPGGDAEARPSPVVAAGGATLLLGGVMPRTVSIMVLSEPSGATVSLGEESRPRGRTPLELKVPRSSTATTVTLRLQGYSFEVLRFVPDRDAKLHLALRPELQTVAATPTKPPTRVDKRAHHEALRPSTKPPPKQPPKPTARPDVSTGAVVDPFSR